MELSILVVKILTIYTLAVGIGMFSGKLNFSKMIKECEDSQVITFILGFFILVLGVTLIQYHNIWVKNWTVLITIVAWGMLIEGFLLIAYPKIIFSFKGAYKHMKPYWGIPFIILGIVLGYFLFIA